MAFWCTSSAPSSSASIAAWGAFCDWRAHVRQVGQHITIIIIVNNNIICERPRHTARKPSATDAFPPHTQRPGQPLLTRRLSFTRASSAQMRGATSLLPEARLAMRSANEASEAPPSPCSLASFAAAAADAAGRGSGGAPSRLGGVLGSLQECVCVCVLHARVKDA